MRSGQIIVLCAIALLTLGLVMVTSAGMRISPATPDAPIAADAGTAVTLEGVLTSRTAIYAGLAIGTLGFVAVLPIPAFARRVEELAAENPERHAVLAATGVGVVLVILALVYVPGLGREMNFSRRWISLPIPGWGDLSVQPSEVAKWVIPVLIACYAAPLAQRMRSFRHGLIPVLGALGLVVLVVMKEDLGTAALIAVAGVCVVLAAGARVVHLLALAPLAAIVLIAGVVVAPYRMRRLVAFLDPYADPLDSGFHMIQSMAAIAGGDGFGRGLGHGLQKFGYLPEDTTDFLFAIVCEEMGIAGAALVIALFCALILAGTSIVRRETSPVLGALGVGIVATVGVQALINLFVVTGMAPTKGIALPLMSSGGTGWLLTAASLGVLVSMDRAAAKREADQDAWDDDWEEEDEEDEWDDESEPVSEDEPEDETEDEGEWEEEAWDEEWEEEEEYEEEAEPARA